MQKNESNGTKSRQNSENQEESAQKPQSVCVDNITALTDQSAADAKDMMSEEESEEEQEERCASDEDKVESQAENISCANPAAKVDPGIQLDPENIKVQVNFGQFDLPFLLMKKWNYVKVKL